MIPSILTNFTAADAYCIVSSPTVNRRSTDSQIQRHYTLTPRLTRLAALFLMLLTLGVGKMWGKDIYYLNVNNWGGVKCHNWGVSGTEWCNAEANMSSTVMTKDNHTYYKITLKNAGNSSCKFYNHTCNTDDATGDLTISGNCYQGGFWINMLPITGGTIIYDNSSTNWVPTGSDKVQFFVGDGGYTSVYDMTKIDHTKLYYKDMSSYGGATYLRFAKANYESNGFNSDNVPTTSTDIYTGTYEFNSNSLYLITTTNTETHPDITTKYIGSDGSLSELNFTITLKAKVKAFGSASYVIGASKGNLNATSYKFSEYKTCGTSTGASPVVASGSTSGNFNAGYTAETSLSVTSITPGYTFKGWYDSDGNKLSDNTEYTTYLPKKTTDVYAYFEEDSWSVAFSNDGNGTVTEPNSTPQTVGQISGIDINASAAFGYQFSTWASSTGGSFGAAGTANTKFYPTAATTVTANFARMYAYIEANFQVYDATRSSRTSVGNVSWKDDSRAIEMAYDGTNRRYYLHTYSTPAQLAERLNNADAYFYIKTTSSSSSTFTDVVSYYADGTSNQSLSTAGSANKKEVTTSSSANSFKFTGSDNGYVIIYFDGTHVWYELEYGVIYEGNGNTGGTVPTDAAYYSGGATVTVKADPDSWAKTGYTFGGWTTADGGSGTKYEAGGTFAVSQNTILYAKWTQTVTLDANDGDTDGSVDVIFHGTTTSSLSVAEREGYTVEAYYADAECTDSKKVLTDNGNLVNYTGYVESNKWVHSGATTLYTNWTAKNYTIPLVNMEATTAGTESVDVTFDASTNMTASDAITKPTKDGYTFGGYYTSENTGATLDDQLIDADGRWIADVTGYTSNDGAGNPTWVHDFAISLYAMWTEDTHNVSVAVSPAGAGSVQVNSSNVTSVSWVGIATQSAEMTPIAAAGWKFKEWRATSNVQMDLLNYHSDYQSGTANKMRINATDDDQTITAVFEPRYYLVGGEITGPDDGGSGTSSGMPGWTNYTDTFKIISNSPSLLATCSLTLGTNKNFYIMVRDKVDGYSYGKSSGTLGDNMTISFVDQDNKVLFYSNGGTEYTFKITAVDGSGRPTVSVERPYQVNVGRKRVDIDGNDHDDNTGGTVAMSKTSGGDAVANGAWVPYGTSVKYDASAESGYSLAWFTGSDYSSQFSTDATFYHIATSTGNGYAKFTEKYTTVTISTNNSAAGSITVGGSAFTWGNTKTAGVTTKRALVVSTNTGYNFTNWSLSSTPDFELQDKASDTDKEVTLAGLGGTNGSTGTLTANFTAKTYSVKLNNDHGGESSDDGTATATYDATSLSSVTDATFTGWTLLGYWNSSAVQVANADGSLIANVDGYTGAGGKWTNDAGETVNLWAHWSRSVTLDDNGGSADGSVTVTYKGTAATPSAPTKTGYHVEAYYAEAGCSNKVMETDGTLVNYSGYVTDGKWTKTDATTLYAKWEANTYNVILHNDHGGESSDDGTATATYDATSLSSITHAQFEGWTLLGYWNSSAVQVADASGNLKKSVSTFTDSDGKWTKTDNAEVWAHWSRTITLDDNVEQRHNGSVSVTYKGAAASHSAPASRTGYTLAGYYDDAAGTTKVMNDDGTLVSNVSGYTDGSGYWTHKTAATLYAKWTSDHFIIYRTGDKDDDPRKLGTDVESYAGGTLDKSIEFRMKVRDLDMWHTLCLPFTVSAVKVWDEDDGEYYGIEPYYREKVGDPIHGGHYIIRTPSAATDLALADFGDWRDPTSPTGYVPTKDAPYIIQWHNSYFLNKYVSFFGATGQTIPTSFSAGTAPSSDNVVNVCVNKSMQTGSVAGAYMLESDYGNGAWLRLDNADESRPIPPFECYLLVNNPTRARYMAIRPGMTAADTPTGWDDVVNSENKAHIIVYSISGVCVTQYSNCSINEAGQRLSESYGEGLYILRADNESVKLMVGGK